MYQVAICDDEVVFTKQLKEMIADILEKIGINYQITIFNRPTDLFSNMEKQQSNFHILFLDIMIGSVNGIEVAHQLREAGNDIGIVFVTCSKEYALEAYSVNPIHYLLKPVDKTKLETVLKKDYTQHFRKRNIIVSVNGGSSAIFISEILYVEVLNRHLFIHLENRVIETKGTLNNFFAQLNSTEFIRCHNSFLVNMKKICDVKRYEFTLHNGTKVPISKNSYQSAQEVFIDFMDEK